jgi:phenylalanyl-tRNA synthetase beta chain
MKLPLSWLREFVTIEADLKELCTRLTVAGLEVESVDHIGPAFTDVFVARVTKVERHPNADRLHLCSVDAGTAGSYRVVCGAPNVYPGMMGALARVGARLAGGVHGAGSGRLEDATPLKAATIRGVASEGMLCSELELGLSDNHEGILDLPQDARPGDPLTSYLGIPDVVIDIAITPNRGDCLSVLGVAREVAALFGVALGMPQFRSGTPSRINSGARALSVDIAAPELCPRYAGLPMSSISLGPSPLWLRHRLELCGMRAVNNIVDVTNYVMLELGQPLHAFDAATIAGNAITVRCAGAEREFETLDGIRRVLQPADLMIADRDKALAIAGVMGGRNSEVSAKTDSIVLESAYFDPATIARTSRRLGLRSEASYRFERGIDRSGQVNALIRAAELIRNLAGGSEDSLPVDLEVAAAPQRTIEFDRAALSAILGAYLPAPEIERRLRAFGATVRSDDSGRFVVVPPSFRPDLNETADIAEEVARLTGLAEIPATLPMRAATVPAPDAGRASIAKLKEILIGCGLVEAKTIAFVAPADNQHFPGFDPAQSVSVSNPLSVELSEMRRSLLPGLLAALRFNLNREARSFHMFEIAKVFGLREGVASESERVAAVSYGEFALGTIGRPALEASYRTAKGILETTFEALLEGTDLEFERIDPDLAPYLHPGRCASIVAAGQRLGIVGELHPAESLRLDLSATCVVFEIDVPRLLACASPRRKIVPPPRFPAVRRDVALVIDHDFPAAKVIRTVSELGAGLLESVELFDVYEGEPLPEGKKSIALACRYRSKDRTLTDDEVNRTHTLLVERAARQLGAELRQ